jgi:hypothetical protein
VAVVDGGAGRGGTAGTGGAGGSRGGADGGATDGGAKCGDHAISPKSTWIATAAFNTSLAPLAVDADVTTRYTSGKFQTGDEWLQVDFGALATVDRVTLDTSSPGDYPVHWQVRLTATSMDLTVPLVIEGDGTSPNIVISFPRPFTGRYLLVSQTGASTTHWWSVHDVNVSCL